MKTLGKRHSFGVMTTFLSFRASRAGVLSDLSEGAFLAPSDKSQKHGALSSVTPEKASLPRRYYVVYLKHVSVVKKSHDNTEKDISFLQA